MEYHLRKATPADLTAINDLFMEMLRSIYGKEEVQGYQEGDLDHYFSDAGNWICVAEQRGKIIAFLSMEVHREQENFIYYDDFSVTKKHRGQGIGSALLDQGEAFARSTGFSTIVLHVEKGNLAARRLYERRGFTVHEEQGSRLCMIKRSTDCQNT